MNEPTQNEPTQDRSVVLAVILFVGAIALGGLAGIVFLIWSGTDATALLAVSGPTTTALGVLGGVLARTATGTQAAEARGAAKALDQVKQLETPAPATTSSPPTQDVGDAAPPVATQAISSKRVTAIPPPLGFGPSVRADVEKRR